MLRKALHFYGDSFRGLSRSVWILSLVMLVNRAGAMVLPFLTVYLTSELSFTLPQAGWVMSCFGLGSVLGSYTGGKLTDRFGYYPVQFWSLVLTAFMFWSLTLVTTFAGFCTVIFLTSFIADAFRPASMVAVAAYSREENRTRSFALIRLAINLGYAIGPALGGLIALTQGYFWLFVIDGLTCLAAALIFRIYLNPRRAPAEEEPVVAGMAGGTGRVWKDRRYLFFILVTVITGMVFMQLLSTLPVYWKEQVGLNEAQIGGLFTLNCLLITLLEMPLIFVLERKGGLHRVMALGALLIGLTYLALILGVSAGVIIASVVLITFGEMLNFPFANAYAVKTAPVDRRGEYMALFTMAYSVAHIFAPQLGLQVAAHLGFDVLWYILTLLGLISMWGYLRLGRPAAEPFPAPQPA
jgi:MFS family permease